VKEGFNVGLFYIKCNNNSSDDKYFPQTSLPLRAPGDVSEPIPSLSPIRCVSSRHEKTFVSFITEKMNEISHFFSFFIA